MARFFRFSMTFLLAVAIVALTGCGIPLKPMQMNNRMARSNEKLATAAKQFYKSLEPLSKGFDPDTSLNTAYEDVQNALRDAQNGFEGVLPPTGSSPGAELLEKYKAFLYTQEIIFNQYITPMYNTAQNRSLDPVSRWREIAPMLRQASTEEATAMEELNRAHQDFCKHHMFEPK